ncbi:LytTR family DNA-binding domain-containing protein [Chryseobacterium sp. ISL-6]|uniref:LytR/AlgR family response regulator transcription factor n=1 Tax=Chryseobacterium sp. ISL-6 TaxID=2819143 RepID=UPI001BEB95A7|nr:LytTR family DNA-binding domain-containing protein [Chryseobacterium sp. ISL-6]MBT2622502.1 response regulator transcription factor [Chryseobacterium sp. ISL-6]
MNCIIIDDEPIARQGMSKFINKVPELILKGIFKNTDEAKSFLDAHDVNLIFLDIQMPGINGVEFAKTLSKNTLVIFTTAHIKYALDSYEVDAIDYLVKPIREERFFKAVNKALEYNYFLSDSYEKGQYKASGENSILIRADRRDYKILFGDILYIEGMKDYVIINLSSGKLITAMNLKTALSKIPENLFVRISKSYIVNVSHITAVANHAVFINDIELPLGISYRKYFMEFYKGKS